MTKGNPEEDAYGFLSYSMKEAIAQDRFRPELSDAEELAQMFWGSLHGIISLNMNFINDPWIAWREPRETIRTMIDVLIRGTVRQTSP